MKTLRKSELKIAKTIRQSVALVFVLVYLSSCSRPVSLKSNLRDRVSRSPESASQLGDTDTGVGQERFKEELSRFNSLQNIPDSDAQFYFLRGELLLAKDSYEEALKSFKLAEGRLKIPSALLAKRIIQIHLKSGELDKAIDAAESYRVKFPEDQQIGEALAGAYSAVGRNDEAIKVYSQIVELTSGKKREELYMMLASIYSINKDSAGAKAVLKKALKENPKNALAIYYYGRIEELEGDLAAAEKKYRKAIKESPESDGLQLELARLLAQTKRFQEAKDIAQLVVKRSPQNPLARQLLGQLMLATNNVEGALSELEKLQSMEQNPNDTRLRIALINLERRDFAAAERELNLVIAARPKDDVARYYLALAYAGQNKVNDVLSAISKITEKDKFYVESRLIGSYVLKQALKSNEAIDLLKDAETKLSAAPDPRILSFLVSMLKELSRPQEAITYQKKLILLEPDRDANYFLLAVLLDESKIYDESIAAGKKAIELNPKNADALNFVGYSIADHGGDLEEAKRYVKAALDIEPKNGYFIDSLGWIYFKEKSYTDAVAELEKAVAIVPADAVILEHLAQAYFHNKDYEKSSEILARALESAAKSDDKGVVSRLKELESELSRVRK